MKYGVFAAAGAVLLLAACGSAKEAQETGDAATEAAAPAETATAEPVAAAGPVEPGSVPTRDFLIGKWGENGDCSVMVIDFKADGTMDGPVEKWNYEDGKLEMVGMPQKQHLKVIDQNTMESRLDGTGDPHKITRC